MCRKEEERDDLKQDFENFQHATDKLEKELSALKYEKKQEDICNESTNLRERVKMLENALKKSNEVLCVKNNEVEIIEE